MRSKIVSLEKKSMIVSVSSFCLSDRMKKILSAVHWSRVVWSLELLDDIELVALNDPFITTKHMVCFFPLTWFQYWIGSFHYMTQFRGYDRFGFGKPINWLFWLIAEDLSLESEFEQRNWLLFVFDCCRLICSSMIVFTVKGNTMNSRLRMRRPFSIRYNYRMVIFSECMMIGSSSNDE